MHDNAVRDAAVPFAHAFPAARSAARREPWLRLVSQVLQLAGEGTSFLRHDERPWSSATFSGARHTIVLAFEGEEAVARGEAYVAALPDHEFTIARQIVADAAVVAVEHVLLPVPCMTVQAELLVLEDC
ncbi:MAG TPA: hypothetical protein VMQ93_09410 [Novosphingobium sp.]|nr:hypothetical protein [Novosphingobium sp.]